MNSAEVFDSVFYQGTPPPRLLTMPLIMTLAARHCGVRYIDYVRDPEVLARAQFEVCEFYSLDIMATTSDPVGELSALGGRLVWFDNDPPAPDPLSPLISGPSDLKKLKLPDPNGDNRMGDRIKAIREMKRLSKGKYPVLGWVEGPISEAAVMRGMTALMEDLIDEPEFIQELFEFNVDMAIDFATAQVEAGADMIGFGDAPASLIGPNLYGQAVLDHEKRMVQAIKKLGMPVRMHICGNTTKLFALMAESGVDMIDVDSVADFTLASELIPDSIQLLGNLDPVREVLYSDPASIVVRLEECHQTAGNRYVVGAGCEIPAKTPDANLLAFSQYAHAHH